MKILFRRSMLLFFLIGLFFSVSLNQSQATVITEQNIYGATHIKEQKSLGSGVSVINYLGADFTKDSFKILTGDHYTKTSYRPATVTVHANNTQNQFDEYIVIGGVNADFFEGFGVPQEAYIKDGEVISSGIGYANRSVIGFKDDGTFVAGKPTFDGFEVIVRDSNGKERIKLPLKNINATYQSSPHDVYAYFDTYRQTLPLNINKFVLDVVETKGAMPKIYGKGIVSQVKNTDAINVGTGQIVLVSQNIYLQNLVQVGDVVSVQRRLSGSFEGVKWGIGVYGHLVEEGKKLDTIIGIDPSLRHPRSAIGIKENGSVFFVTVDGRDPGVSIGATLYELADIMINYGAVTAYNFDGGGSTTMVLRNNQDNFYIANKPSSNTAREVTNSMFLALQVRFDDRSPHPIPDFSVQLDKPINITSSKGILTWDTIQSRTSYQVKINGEYYTTINALLDLKQIIKNKGQYNIEVTAKGDGILFRDSLSSETYQFNYEGPDTLKKPDNFVFINNILYWDQNEIQSKYQVSINDRVYTITLNRFNLATQNLAPGVYAISIKSIGDGFNDVDSEEYIYYYRVYSAVEKEIKETLKVFLEILYYRNR